MPNQSTLALMRPIVIVPGLRSVFRGAGRWSSGGKTYELCSRYPLDCFILSNTFKIPVLINCDRPLVPRIAKHGHRFAFKSEVVQMRLDRNFDLSWPDAWMIKRAIEIVRL